MKLGKKSLDSYVNTVENAYGLQSRVEDLTLHLSKEGVININDVFEIRNDTKKLYFLLRKLKENDKGWSILLSFFDIQKMPLKQLAPGLKNVGQWERGDLLGNGASSNVYRCKRPSPGQTGKREKISFVCTVLINNQSN